jgi:glycosyltransferase involved in cell wall biosynthesis
MKTLAVLGVPGAAEKNGLVMTSSPTGLLVTELAGRFDQVQLAVPGLPADDPQLDCTLPANVSFTPLPAMTSALQGLRLQGKIAEVYREVLASADAVFVRGVLIPAVGTIFSEAAARDIPVIHWLVGDPVALLKSHSRQGRLRDALSMAFAWNWERQVRAGAAGCRSVLLCNGQEIADRHPRAHTRVVVSTSLVADDIKAGRQDTCDQDPIKILTVAYIRPEKGIEYLLQALPLLRTSRPVQLTLVGSRDKYPGYQMRLDTLVKSLGLADKVTWAGHVPRQQLGEHFSQADIFVLPTLSEGTPRVLLEAMASGVPLVASRVGGIPSAVTDGQNGLLVEAKDPQALAQALDRLVADAQLRRKLIVSGYDFARQNTIDRFADRILGIFADLAPGRVQTQEK